MTEETKVVWERESDEDLARLLGQVPHSVAHTVRNDQEVKRELDNSRSVFFQLKSERLYAEAEDGTKLTKESDFPGRPDATIIAFSKKTDQVTLELTKETQEQLKQYQQNQRRSR